MPSLKVLPSPQPLIAAGLAACASIALVLALQAPVPHAPGAGGGEGVSADAGYGNLPLAFEPNAGRAHPGVDFIASGPSGSAFITGPGATLALAHGKGRRLSTEALSLGFAGAADSKPVPLQKLPGVVNDLRGDDPSKWRTELATYERIRYRQIYPGVSLDWHGDRRRLEYDLRLAPGADVARIAIRVNGAEKLRLAADGDLLLDTGRATLRQRAPVAFQASPSGRSSVEASFALSGNRVSIHLGSYDHSRPLVIDPVLSYSTYLGGDGSDLGTGIAVDSSGSSYLTGRTASTDFNTESPIEGDGTGTDAFVSKLNPAGSALTYSTYLGGDGTDIPGDIAVDPSGSAYVAGQTASTDFNTVAPIEGDGTGTDAFVSKLNPAGSALTYSTYLGGDGTDIAGDIAIDSSGSAYVTGLTASTDFNTVAPIEADGTGTDAFVSKLNPAGSALTYSTYLGGDAFDGSSGIAVDSSGSAYVTGQTASTDFNTAAPIEGDGTGDDAFVSKLNPAGSALTYSTYVGGDAFDGSFGIAVDSSGSAYVIGTTDSTDFNTVGPIEGDETGSDTFASKLSNPTNDDFLAPAMLAGANASATGASIGGSKQTGEPVHAGNPGGASVWYRWTAAAAGDVTIDTCASDFNTLLAAYTGGAIGSLSQVAANDNAVGCGGDGLKSRITFAVAADTTYQIAVDGFGGVSGNVALSLAFTAPPPSNPPANPPAATPPAPTKCKKGFKKVKGKCKKVKRKKKRK